jgi:hypothetical protein
MTKNRRVWHQPAGLPPGTELALGEAATIPIRDIDSQGIVSFAVDDIEPGTAEDLAALFPDGDETGELFRPQSLYTGGIR